MTDKATSGLRSTSPTLTLGNCPFCGGVATADCCPERVKFLDEYRARKAQDREQEVKHGQDRS